MSIYFLCKQLGFNRERLHDGVIKDIERQQRKKIENIFILQQQAELTKQLKEIERQSNLQNE